MSLVGMMKMPWAVLVNLVLLNKDAPETSGLCLELSVFHIETWALFTEYGVGRQTLWSRVVFDS